MLTVLGGMVSAQLWQRRKLRRIAHRITYEAQLMLSAIRITNEVRGSLDIAQTLETTAREVAHALNIEHCCIRFDRDSLNAFACSCGEREHEFHTGATFTSALNALGEGRAARFLSHNDPSRRDSDSAPRSPPVLGIPITRVGDSCDGTLLVLSLNPGRLWLESEVQMLLAVAHQLALSVDHARVFASVERESLTDPLTSCLNRRAFDLQFNADFRTAEEHGAPISLILLDLDLFKNINDDHGHTIGDNALQALAGILLEEKANGAIAARVGGDEFAMIMQGCALQQARVVAERVRRNVKLLNRPDLGCRFTISVGVASFPLHASSPSSLYAAADKALYHAKTSGRDRVRVF